MRKLLILDGNSLLHRAYYALPDWRNRSGEATAGVYGFLSMMLKAIDELKPSHLAVVFDCPEPTFRHLLYVGYQVTRERDRQVSEDIWGQVEKLKIVLGKMNIPVFAVAGFEADDVIGTIVRKTQRTQRPRVPEKPDYLKVRQSDLSDSPSFPSILIVTGDRDLMQLVDDTVNLYMPQKGLSDGQIIDRDKVKERLVVWPEQVVDYKALVGDSSDNYPGVAGIGPKTAVKLLEEFGSFEKIYESLNITPQPPLTLRGSLVERLVSGYGGGVLSKKLATIKIDVPMTWEWDQSRLPDQAKILDVLKELGYKSLVKRVGGKEDEDSTRPRLFE